MTESDAQNSLVPTNSENGRSTIVVIESQGNSIEKHASLANRFKTVRLVSQEFVSHDRRVRHE
jgi:hypothetical protein